MRNDSWKAFFLKLYVGGWKTPLAPLSSKPLMMVKKCSDQRHVSIKCECVRFISTIFVLIITVYTHMDHYP